MNLLHLIWPYLEGGPSREELKSSFAADCDRLRKGQWRHHLDLALAESRRLAEAETARRTSTDARASTYLLVVAGLVPILTYLESSVWDRKAGTAPRELSLPLLLFGVIYLLMSGWHAFKTLRVITTTHMDSGDLIRLWMRRDPRPGLIETVLYTTRCNQDLINEKISQLKLSHEFLIRSFSMFVALLLLEGGWEFLSLFLKHQELPRHSLWRLV